MTNGGMYTNIKTINGINTVELDSIKIRNMITKNDFLDIEHKVNHKSLIRTDCISSINFFD
jgi:hypothetical protein